MQKLDLENTYESSSDDSSGDDSLRAFKAKVNRNAQAVFKPKEFYRLAPFFPVLPTIFENIREEKEAIENIESVLSIAESQNCLKRNNSYMSDTFDTSDTSWEDIEGYETTSILSQDDEVDDDDDNDDDVDIENKLSNNTFTISSGSDEFEECDYWSSEIEDNDLSSEVSRNNSTTTIRSQSSYHNFKDSFTQTSQTQRVEVSIQTVHNIETNNVPKKTLNFARYDCKYVQTLTTQILRSETEIQTLNDYRDTNMVQESTIKQSLTSREALRLNFINDNKNNSLNCTTDISITDRLLNNQILLQCPDSDYKFAGYIRESRTHLSTFHCMNWEHLSPGKVKQINLELKNCIEVQSNVINCLSFVINLLKAICQY